MPSDNNSKETLILFYQQVVMQYAQGRMTTAGREFESLFNDKDIRILDAGAGTGLVSVEVSSHFKSW